MVYFFYYVFLHILINLKQQPVKIMGKNIKNYATFPQSISPRKMREALWQKRPNVQIFLFKYGTVLPYTFVSKFTSKIFQ